MRVPAESLIARIGPRASVMLLAAGFGLLGAVAGFLVPTILAANVVAVLGLAVAGLTLCYLIPRPTHERALHLAIFYLAFHSAFVLDIGLSLRLSQILVMLAAVLLPERRPGVSGQGRTLVLLYLFILAAVTSNVFTLDLPQYRAAEGGLRGTAFRSFVQTAGLLLMVAGFLITYRYIRTLGRLRLVAGIIALSSVVVALYGYYEVSAAPLGLPFVNINTDYLAPGQYRTHAGSLALNVEGVALPRPRSTFPEPVDLASFLLMAIPLTAAFLRTRSPSPRKPAVIFLATLPFVVLFLLADSRSALIGAGVASATLALVFWRRISWPKVLLSLSAVYLLLALVVFPALGAPAEIGGPVQHFRARVESAFSLVGRSGPPPGEESLARVAIGIWRDHPVLGVGIGNFPFHFYARTERTIQDAGASVIGPFNLYLRLLAELGLVGTVLFLAFVASLSWDLLSVARRSQSSLGVFAAASLFAIVALVVQRVATESLYTDTYFWVMLAVGAASVAIQRRSLEKPLHQSVSAVRQG